MMSTLLSETPERFRKNKKKWQIVYSTSDQTHEMRKEIKNHYFRFKSKNFFSLFLVAKATWYLSSCFQSEYPTITQLCKCNIWQYCKHFWVKKTQSCQGEYSISRSPVLRPGHTRTKSLFLCCRCELVDVGLIWWIPTLRRERRPVSLLETSCCSDTKRFRFFWCPTVRKVCTGKKLYPLEVSQPGHLKLTFPNCFLSMKIQTWRWAVLVRWSDPTSCLSAQTEIVKCLCLVRHI